MKSPTLRRMVTHAATDQRAARAELEHTLRASQGPIIEPDPSDPARTVVSFVVLDRHVQPFVTCGLFAEPDKAYAMSEIPGIPGAWWAEVTARSDACTVYQFQSHRVPVPVDLRSDDTEAITAYARDVYQAGFADPLNPDSCYPIAALMWKAEHAAAPPDSKRQSILHLPDAAPYPWHDEPARRGHVERRRVKSRILHNSRTVTCWSPPGVSAEGLPMVVLLDGESFLHGMDALRIFDNLVLGRHVPPFAAALVHNASPSSRLIEYPCQKAFSSYLADELIPALGIDPKRTEVTVGGYSYGALAACWTAYDRPDTFHKVLSLSASLWWGPDGQPEWLTQQYETADPKPITFWIDVGALETNRLVQASDLTMISVCRTFRDALQAKGYTIAGYRERPGGHDYANWRQALPEGIIALLRQDGGTRNLHANDKSWLRG